MCITLFGYAYSLCGIFAIVIVYVKYLNFVETLEELTRIVDYLKWKIMENKIFSLTCRSRTFQTKY